MTDPASPRLAGEDVLRAEVERLRWSVLQLGGRLNGFDHALIEESSKPSDPSDIRWDCLCGYGGSPEKVRRHWAQHLVEDFPLAASQQAAAPAELDVERLAAVLRDVDVTFYDTDPHGYFTDDLNAARKIAAAYRLTAQAAEQGEP